jgi:hypothetical protein
MKNIGVKGLFNVLYLGWFLKRLNSFISDTRFFHPVFLLIGSQCLNNEWPFGQLKQ